MGMGSLTISAPAGMVTVLAWEKVTSRRVPATAVARSACAAMSAAPIESGVVLRWLDSLMRTDFPPTEVCTTIRIVWFAKLGPPIVMLGPHAAVLGALAASAPGTTNTAASTAATETRYLFM